MSKTTYLDFLDGVKSYYGTGSDQWVEIAKYGLKADNAFDILSQVPDVNIIKNADGTVRGITYKDFTSWGGHTSNIGGSLNSNTIGGSANASKSFHMDIPSNTKLNESTKQFEMVSEIGTKTSTGKKVIGVLGKIGQAVLAVGTACTLGKIIDKSLYNLNPDFWNAHDMETLNPDTWASITNSGSLGDDIFNVLMGVDPDTNETTAYVDQNALAYMALYMQQKNIFDSSISFKVDESTMSEDDKKTYNERFPSGISAIKTDNGRFSWSNGQYTKFIKTSESVYHFGLVSSTSNEFSYGMANYETFKWGWKNDSPPTTLDRNASIYGIYYTANYTGGGIRDAVASVPTVIENTQTTYASPNLASSYLLKYGKEKQGSLDGVDTQDDATVPDLSNASTVNDVLDILKTALPFLFANAISNSVPQPDGSIKDYTYVPITLPNTNNANNPQPETGGQTQAKPQVNPDTSPDTLLDLITKLLGTKLDTPNPPNTGTGNTPPIVLPTGSASALYKIYNPSQAELNSFGAWLWSSNFVDQLLKVFNNPMESIIGLHKVYASPVIGGTSHIKVGYLDSGVSSNFVSNQYTKINCGTVNLQEYFGNVFDYAPYTTIELYLPCIGFVQLDVSNVMRSSINITYTVDVLTGACLAEVNVKRDNSGGVLYSYSGNCASQYPLSSGSYMGIVSSVIGVAGSIVGTVASGGSLAPLALGATSGLLNAKTRVQHSGSLSGNSGVMGGKIPYLIITRPQTNMAENFEHYQGLPSNVYSKLSSCSGFVKVKNVNVQNINAESAELDEIKTLLLDGVII
jgi:hypothetical protein